jgi:hypothetical protein
MRNVGNQSLRLIAEPFLIAKECADDHHRRPEEMVIEISLEEADFRKLTHQPIHDGSFPFVPSDLRDAAIDEQFNPEM